MEKKPYYIRQRDAAEMIGVTPRTLQNWTRREAFPELARTPRTNSPIGYVRHDVDNWIRKTWRR